MGKEATVFDNNLCTLGEGPIWHPERNSLIWFDIIGKRLFERSIGDASARKLEFDIYVSAAGIIGDSEVLLATSTGLGVLNLDSGDFLTKINLEDDRSDTRSNDGRADPQGGFWIGTMGIKMEPDAGAIYRYHRGELRKLYSPITVPNSICFSPCGKIAYFTDTVLGKIFRVQLDLIGWPKSEPEVIIDFKESGINPDGSVVDTEGCIWNAQWGSSRVARYDPNGELVSTINIDAPQTSCPAFGSHDLKTLFVTTARDGMAESDLEKEPLSGSTFCYQTTTIGQKENRVIMS